MAPGTAAGHYANAQVLLMEKKDPDGAIAEFRQAIDLDPFTWFPHNDYANALAAKGDWDGAIFEYRQALRMQPDSVVAHSNLGYALANKGDLAGGTEEIQKALRINPNTPWPHLVNGMILAVQKKMPAAMDEYREVIRLDPDNAHAHYLLGKGLEGKWGSRRRRQRNSPGRSSGTCRILTTTTILPFCSLARETTRGRRRSIARPFA